MLNIIRLYSDSQKVEVSYIYNITSYVKVQNAILYVKISGTLLVFISSTMQHVEEVHTRK